MRLMERNFKTPAETPLRIPSERLRIFPVAQRGRLPAWSCSVAPGDECLPKPAASQVTDSTSALPPHKASPPASSHSPGKGRRYPAPPHWPKRTPQAARLYRGKASRPAAEPLHVRLILRDPSSHFLLGKLARRRHLRAIRPQLCCEKQNQLLLLFRRKRIGGLFDFGERAHRWEDSRTSRRRQSLSLASRSPATSFPASVSKLQLNGIRAADPQGLHPAACG